MLKNKSVIDRMDLWEKAAMLSGKDTWRTMDFEKYGIPSVFLSDGPHGLRKQKGAGDHLGLNPSVPATCYPTAATMANSWDEQLCEELGEHLGKEAAALDVHVVLGPGLNMKRSPLCGRNFEYFSEDPYLAGKLAAAYIRGIQKNGTAACPKHFAANSQELRRMSNNSVIDERAFREIYATGFEIAVKEGHPLAVMSAYNQVNGVYANENKHLLLELLVDEWGFDGFVVSDWGGSNDHALGVQNGSHLEMPSTGRAGAGELVKAVREGKLDEKVIDQRLDELLTVIFALHQAAEERKESDRKYDAGKHHEFAKKAARESIVLLKNDENILPLKPKSKVTVIGDFAKTPRYQGAGSSLVNAVKADTTLDLINSYGLALDRYVQGYERNCPADAKLLEQAAAAAKDAEYVLIYAGLDEISESEGMDREHMRMPDSQVKLIEAAAEVNQNVIVILSAGSAVEMPWIGRVKAVVHGYLSGQAGAGAMLEVLTGKHNPCGRLNETYPLKYADTPAYHYFPGKQRNSEYRESIFIGYRYYETAGKAVQFPFGFGLSYTTFSYSDLKADKTGAVFQIMNTGDMEGAEIAQLYVRKKSSRIFRADRELKGFQKVHLKPGETKTVTILFDDKTFRYFDMETNGWEVEEGEYEILIGRNASDIVLQEKLFVQGSNAKKIYSMEQLPSYFSADIQNVDDSQFEQVLGTAIPDGSWGTDGKIGMNDAICQMYYAKSRLARLVYHILTKLKKRSEARGKPNLNILFIYNMPFRGVAKMTGGSVTVPMAEALVEMVNGKFFSGLRHLIKAARER